jgi:hypothetical protein
MKPTKYEALISQLIDNEVDMDELRALVAAEKNKRKKEAEDAKAREQKQQLINGLRSDLIDTLIAYAEEIIDDDDVTEYLESDKAIAELEKALIDVEKSLIQTKTLLNDTSKVERAVKNWRSFDEDAIREWLNNRRK